MPNVGDIVKVRSCGKRIFAFLIRTYTDEDFRAVPAFTSVYFEALKHFQSGDMESLKTLRPQIESHSEIYSETV